VNKWSFAALLLVGATVLGGTVLREPIASAAQGVSSTIVGPLDANGNVKVHEQGTATVSVAGTPAVKLADSSINETLFDENTAVGPGAAVFSHTVRLAGLARASVNLALFNAAHTHFDLGPDVQIVFYWGRNEEGVFNPDQEHGNFFTPFAEQSPRFLESPVRDPYFKVRVINYSDTEAHVIEGDLYATN
jgi:hypothetical protein